MKTEDVNAVVNDLVDFFERNKKELLKLNEACTQDTDYWIEEDWKYALAYLINFKKNIVFALKQRRKPKGIIFIILSYNEPLLLSIIPILNALAGGNKVIVKPSRRAEGIWNAIWIESGIVERHNLMLETVSGNSVESLEKYIKKSSAVYFFGGHGIAKKVYKVCAKHFVEFYPEIETADCKIIDIHNVDQFDVEEDVSLTLRESFSHAGQICHRIQGVAVVGGVYDKYKKMLEKKFDELEGEDDKCLNEKFNLNESYLKFAMNDIDEAKPKNIRKHNNGLPFLIIEPDKGSAFVKSAYFLPALWIVKIKSEKELISFLNGRSYFLGVNIMCDDDIAIEKIIESTNFSRYTVNTSHTKIRLDEGWGGNWPSGFSGYKNWFEQFTNQFDKITTLS